MFELYWQKFIFSCIISNDDEVNPLEKKQKTYKEIKEQQKIKAPIVEALKAAYENPTYQFHIPGHTRGKSVHKDFKKLVGETTPEDFEIMKQKVQKACDEAISKKDKVIKYISEN